jgi:diaminopimelate decarboxylase
MPASQNPRALSLDGPYLAVRDGCLTLEGADLGEIADRFGTPCYVTSEGQIRANYRRLREAFTGLYPATRLLYANKANSNLAVRRILAQEGAGGDCFGLGELTLCLQAGVPPQAMVLNGSNKGEEELTVAVKRGVRINVDHPDELVLLEHVAAGLGRKAEVNLRILPFSYADLGALSGDLVEIARDTSHDKWGMDRETAREALAWSLRSDWVKPRGLHMHVSRLRPDAEPFMLACNLLTQAMAELRDTTGWTPETLDLGGGYAHLRDPESGVPAGSHAVATFEEYGAGMIRTLRDGLERYRLPEPELWLEPGRSLVSNASLLLTRIGIVKRLPNASVTWVNVDASTNHCLRASLQGYHYTVVPVERPDAPPDVAVTVTGPTCTLDVIAADRQMRPVQTGDLLAILDVGGYAEVMATQFNLLPRPASVLVNNGEAELIRRRETYADLTTGQIVPPRLI